MTTNAITPPKTMVEPAPIAPDINATSICPILFAPMAANECALLALPSNRSGVVN